MQAEAEQRNVPPLQRQGQIETDTFCDGCGYNLHGQPVARDPRLGLMVCRCPECGGWHAAGKGTTAASLWLSRVATLALVLWVQFVLFAAFWLCMGLGAVQVVHVDEFSYRHWVAADGRDVERSNVINPGAGQTGWVYKGTTQPANPTRLVRRPDPPADDMLNAARRREQLIIGSVILTVSDLALGIVGGMLLVTFFWHWKRQRYRFVLLLPFAVAGVVLAGMFVLDDDYDAIRGWAVSRVFTHAALQAMFMYVGILIGRPMARGLLRMIIPPRPRQVFAFLWRADGKPMPGAAPASA